MKIILEFDINEDPGYQDYCYKLATEQFPEAEVVTRENKGLPTKYINVTDAAAMLKISKRTFLNLSLRGDLPAPIIYEGKKVWERESIKKVAEELGIEENDNV